MFRPSTWRGGTKRMGIVGRLWRIQHSPLWGVERRTTNLREVHVMDSDSPKQLDDHHQPIPLTSDTDASCTRQSYFIR
jgi:hypothetical protein